jgi:seryl-tRNA synthetase
MFKARMIGLLAGTCLFGMASPAFAQPAAVTEKLADFKSASQQLKELYAKSKAIAKQIDAAVKKQQSASQQLKELKAIAEQIDAAVKKQQAAEMALTDAIQGVDPESQQDEKLVEQAYAEVAAARQSISAAELDDHESEAIANEDAYKTEQQ